jgi:signal transduction histidine kinase
VLSAKSHYYLFFKDETTQPLAKDLRFAVGDSLDGPFGPAGKTFSPSWVEGPAVFPVDDDYVCIFHYYGNNRWGAMKSADLEHWTDVTERLNMPPNSHPGTVLEVPRDILLSLWRAGRADIGPAPETSDLGVGNWIWADTVADKQTCLLWRSFEVPAGTLVSRATLRITADNGYRAFLDGREIGRGGDLNYLTEYDLTQLMTPGSHVLAVEGFNDALSAGVILGMNIQMSSGKPMEILSDPSWFIVPTDEKNWTTREAPKPDWKPARVVGFTGKFGWLRPAGTITLPPLLPQRIYFWQREWFLILLLVTCALVVVFSVRQGLKLTVQTHSQKLLERERDRIARDIHDDLGAGLTQLTLLGELVLRETPPGAATRTQIDSLCGKSRTLLGTMDELVWTVNSRRDTVHDFAAFVCEHAQEFLASTAIRCRLDVPEDLPPIPLDLPARRNLLLAVKEAVRNAARHSGASELFLKIRVADQNLVVVLEDNGKGFATAAGRTTRNGLHNMEERMSDIGGACRITATPDKGCRIVFILPLHSPALAKNWLSIFTGIFFRRSNPTDFKP